MGSFRAPRRFSLGFLAALSEFIGGRQFWHITPAILWMKTHPLALRSLLAQTRKIA
jgi:hypothetical protein